MKIDLYTQKGEKKGAIDISDVMFKAEVHEELMRLAVIRQLANARSGTAAHAKTRGEVRGGGKKPWKQKGTGRARFGSTRNPIWRSGGAAFGPRNDRNYSKDMPRKARKIALFSVLTQKATDSEIFALDGFNFKEPRTKDFVSMMAKLPVKRSLLVVLSEKDAVLEKSANNIPNVKTILVNYLNPHDLLKYEKVMFLESALKKAEDLFIK